MNTTSSARLGDAAVVCGAGIAGLLTARVLSEFFDRVVIIERDEAELGRRWRRAILLANDDPEIGRLFLETISLARSPDWLFTGDVADRLAVDDLATATA